MYVPFLSAAVNDAADLFQGLHVWRIEVALAISCFCTCRFSMPYTPLVQLKEDLSVDDDPFFTFDFDELESDEEFLPVNEREQVT